MATTASASMERSTTMAGHSLVNSSMTLSNFKVRLSSVVSNWKSRAHSALGAMRLMAPTLGPDATEKLFRLRWAPEAFVTPKALDPLVVDVPARPACLQSLLFGAKSSTGTWCNMPIVR